DVAAVAELETGIRDGLAEKLDRLVALGVRQVRAQADDDLGGVPVGEEIAEALLGRPRRLRTIEDDPADEVRVIETRHGGDAVLERHLDELALELAEHLLGGRGAGLLLLRGRGPALGGCPRRPLPRLPGRLAGAAD